MEVGETSEQAEDKHKILHNALRPNVTDDSGYSSDVFITPELSRGLGKMGDGSLSSSSLPCLTPHITRHTFRLTSTPHNPDSPKIFSPPIPKLESFDVSRANGCSPSLAASLSSTCQDLAECELEVTCTGTSNIPSNIPPPRPKVTYIGSSSTLSGFVPQRSNVKCSKTSNLLHHSKVIFEEPSDILSIVLQPPKVTQPGPSSVLPNKNLSLIHTGTNCSITNEECEVDLASSRISNLPNNVQSCKQASSERAKPSKSKVVHSGVSNHQIKTRNCKISKPPKNIAKQKDKCKSPQKKNNQVESCRSLLNNKDMTESCKSPPSKNCLERQLAPVSRVITRRRTSQWVFVRMMREAGYLAVRVLKYLSGLELLRLSHVNTQLRDLILSEKHLSGRRAAYISGRRRERDHIGKENCVGHKRSDVERVETYLTLSPRKQLSAIQNLNPPSPKKSLAEITVTPSQSERFIEEGRSLPRDEQLQKCVKCRAPARVQKCQQRATCSCGYDYCTRCFLPYHTKPQECPALRPRTRAGGRGGGGIFSNRCKRSLRRL